MLFFLMTLANYMMFPDKWYLLMDVDQAITDLMQQQEIEDQTPFIEMNAQQDADKIDKFVKFDKFVEIDKSEKFHKFDKLISMFAIW